MSDVSHRKTSRPLYSQDPFAMPVAEVRRVLPHFFRSIKGLLSLLCFLALLVVVFIANWELNAALKQARWEAQLAERELRDPEFKMQESYTKKWTLSWPALSTGIKFSSPVRANSIDDAHEYDTNGLLHANLNSTRHPILDLIEKGEQDWKALKARQSKNLTDVVTEYKRRYKRNPPIGFGAWFVLSHHCLSGGV
jgi:hypothetical protein